MLCRKGLGSLLMDLEVVDRVYEVDKKDAESKRKILSELQQQKYEYIICPHESFRSAFWVNSLSAVQTFGFSNWWNFLFFTKRRKRPMNLPDALRQLSLLTLINREFAEDFRAIEMEPELQNSWSLQSDVVDWRKTWQPDWSKMRCDLSNLKRERLDAQIFFAPGSTWETKKWGKEKYIELGKRLSAGGYRIGLLGSPDEASLCQEVANEIPGAQSWAGRLSLTETVVAMSQGQLLVCNDSGAMHMAAVAGLPSISIFGPTTLDLGYRPWQAQAAVVQQELDCRPCGLHGAKACPKQHHNCMKTLAVENVEAVTKQFLTN